MARRETLLAERSDLERGDERIHELEQAHGEAKSAFLAAARGLSEERRRAAVRFGAELEQLVADLAMEETKFAVQFGEVLPEADWTVHGIDEAEFYLSPNPGEELRPLARIVSGGELSRVMLAIKTLTAASRHGYCQTADRPPSGAAIRAGFVVVPGGAARAFLAPFAVSLLASRLEDEWARATLPPTLERLGIRTLGELAALPDDAVADRFGEQGLVALRMTRGVERPLGPRSPRPELVQELELPEAASGMQLERTLALLVDRLLADPRRGGRGFRRLRLFARLAAGGGWRADATLRSSSSDRTRIRLALAPKLSELPAPAAALGLRALTMGPPEGEQPSLARDERERRRERLGEAVRQVRSAAGAEAILRVLDVDPASRVPERRVALTPYPEIDR
jgi:protein ImuB